MSCIRTGSPVAGRMMFNSKRVLADAVYFPFEAPPFTANSRIMGPSRGFCTVPGCFAKISLKRSFEIVEKSAPESSRATVSMPFSVTAYLPSFASGSGLLTERMAEIFVFFFWFFCAQFLSSSSRCFVFDVMGHCECGDYHHIPRYSNSVLFTLYFLSCRSRRFMGITFPHITGVASSFALFFSGTSWFPFSLFRWILCCVCFNLSFNVAICTA